MITFTFEARLGPLDGDRLDAFTGALADDLDGHVTDPWLATAADDGGIALTVQMGVPARTSGEVWPALYVAQSALRHALRVAARPGQVTVTPAWLAI